MTDKMKYEVLILRRDQAHIQVMETEDFKEADKRWAELDSQWAACIKDTTPFKLRKPVITSFDPGLIYEITVVPVSSAPAKNPDNPYQQEMQRKGLGATLRGGVGPDMLDGGYIR